MKNISFLLSLFILTSCATNKAPVTPIDIQLEELEGNYLDLSKYPNSITIGGTWKGDRLVLQNASGKTIHFIDAKVESEHEEDAIAIAGHVQNFSMQGSWKVNNAISFWGTLENVEIANLQSKGAHTGIRATRNGKHKGITIRNCIIENTTHEGIYIGISIDTEEDVQNVQIIGNELSNIGWDGIQIGNCLYCKIEGNKITNAGKAKKPWQDYAITINPGSQVYVSENSIASTTKEIQVLDSRVFFVNKYAEETRYAEVLDQ
jgi:parallel beta-helix repeat protein